MLQQLAGLYSYDIYTLRKMLRAFDPRGADELLGIAHLQTLPLGPLAASERPIEDRITSYNVCYTKLLRPP